MVFSKKTRKNSSAQNIHDRTDVRKAEGKALAESPARKKWIKDNLHRMQSGVFATNMIKALEMHSWQNTVEDWQRYYETKYAQQLRRAGTKKRKNPAEQYYTVTMRDGDWTIAVIASSAEEAKKIVMKQEQVPASEIRYVRSSPKRRNPSKYAAGPWYLFGVRGQGGDKTVYAYLGKVNTATYTGDRFEPSHTVTKSQLKAFKSHAPCQRLANELINKHNWKRTDCVSGSDLSSYIEEKTMRDVNEYLTNKGWKGQFLVGYLHQYELRMWNSFDSDEKAFKWYQERMDSLARSIEGEWRSRHSAMTPKGASAYADNWN